VLLGQALSPTPLTPEEAAWQASFPGRMAHFELSGDGGSLLVRWVHAPTRKLHPSRHCYLGAGWRIAPRSAWKDAEGRTWSRFEATSPDGRVLEVRELLVSDDGERSLPDVEAWYWSASLDGTPGRTWYALTWALPPPASAPRSPRPAGAAAEGQKPSSAPVTATPWPSGWKGTNETGSDERPVPS